MLRGGGEGFVLGCELGDGSPLFVFGGDGFVGGEFGTGVLQHAEQHASRGCARIVARVRALVGVVRLVDGDVGLVGLASAGEGDVEVLPCHGRIHQDVRAVDGDALGAVGGDGVAEFEVLGCVGGWEHDCPAPFVARAAHGQEPVAADVGHCPSVAVTYPGPACA